MSRSKNDRSKPRSLLYADYVKQRGWDRDFVQGSGPRRYRKKQNLRWQRRKAAKEIRGYLENMGSFHYGVE